MRDVLIGKTLRSGARAGNQANTPIADTCGTLVIDERKFAPTLRPFRQAAVSLSLIKLFCPVRRSGDQFRHALSDLWVIKKAFHLVDQAILVLGLIGLRCPFGILLVTRHGAGPTAPFKAPTHQRSAQFR